METLVIAGKTVEVDVMRTAEVYRTLPSAGESGGCLYCRNFEVASSYLPSPVLRVLDRMGVRANSPAEAIEYNVNSDKTHFYSAWYFVVGCVVGTDAQSGDALGTHVIGTEWLPGDWSIVLDEKSDLIPDGFPDPFFRLEVFCNLPWLLPENPGD